MSVLCFSDSVALKLVHQIGEEQELSPQEWREMGKYLIAMALVALIFSQLN